MHLAPNPLLPLQNQTGPVCGLATCLLPTGGRRKPGYVSHRCVAQRQCHHQPALPAQLNVRGGVLLKRLQEIARQRILEKHLCVCNLLSVMRLTA